ncbi:flagellar biosynthesis protein FlhF [Agaribacterium haliotis]|uniref:flagellar biosynthesis protein FlhF n=1 Tax=Agaribacterium haliotis TaxID=2013869 RepID=UPI000BB56F91|nr:flagellar biosynthesis protein FlhF [Agaribacterium haliotis]
MNDSEAEVKRFVAPSMSQALALVRDEMGPEAVILSSKKINGGVEIITSLEPDYHTRGVPERRDFGQKFDTELDHAMSSDSSWQSQAGIEQALASYPNSMTPNERDQAQVQPKGVELAAEIERARERMLAARKAAAQAEQQVSAPQANELPASAVAERSPPPKQAWSEDLVQEQKLAGLKEEIADLRLLLEQQSWAAVASDVQEPTPSRSKVHSHLERVGLSPAVISEIHMAVPHGLRLNDAWKQSLATLAKGIPVAEEYAIERGGCFAFVGPTGVGKTTTLAKLAAQYTLRHGPGKVALLTLDSHRVGAVEQLRSLSKILAAPLKVVGPRSSLLSCLADFREFPLVLIDTAGFRHGDTKLAEQEAQLAQCPQLRRMLVLSSLSQSQHLKASVHAYKARADRDLCVLSKLDEACSLGDALSALWQSKLPLAYITDGQSIPDDIHRAKRHDLISRAVSLSKASYQQEQASF